VGEKTNESSYPQPWKEVEHTADWALLVTGSDRRALFKNAARGMLSLIGGEPAPDARPQQWSVQVEAADWEMLLVDWLTEILIRIDEDHVVISDVYIHDFEAFQLQAQIVGRQSVGFNKHIKAVTFHNLEVQAAEQGYETTIVFDV
jgi:SHS2 domain-containing protein